MDVADLRGHLDGELFVPDSPGYHDVRRPVHPAYRDVHPRIVIRCGSDADVAAGIRYARETGLPVVPRGGGHCFAGRSTTDGIVLDLADLHHISITDGRLATIGAGARLAHVYAVLHRHGRTIPAGCGATVGIAGLTLGGGLGLLGRTYGLTCDRLVGARVVLADGRVVDCAADREPDLFWALRGAGGGQFGVVISLVFDTVPEPTTTRFLLSWPHPPAAEMITAWQGWAPAAPDELTANLTVIAEPGRPPRVVLFGAALLAEAATGALLREFWDSAGADVDVRGGLAYHDLKRSFEDLDPPGEAAAGPHIRSELFARPMRPATVDTLLATLSDGEDRRQLAFTVLGGAYNRVPDTATAFAHRGQLFNLEHIAEGSGGWVDRSWSVAHVDASGHVYQNFPDPQLDDWATAYHAGNYPRLAAIKRAYDPDRLFDFHQAV
jgi:FAD/FMN-containing dehydrogenase